MIEISINQNDQNKRLDNFLKKYFPNAPLSFIYRLFRKKDIKVNKRPQKMDYITKVGDIVQVYITKEQEEEFVQHKALVLSQAQDFFVIYEDEHILVVNKPAELLVHEGDVDKKDEDTLTRQVLNYLIKNHEYNPEVENTFVPSLAHRLDRNTSGIVLFGKTNVALQELFKAFKDHGGMDKVYVTLVSGKILQKGTVHAALVKDEKNKLVHVDEKRGLPATSIYHPIQNFKDCTLTEVKIVTGRTHQIRVHMKHIQHPIVGDQKYGNENSDALAKKYKMRKYFLHARKICFHNLQGPLEYLNEREFNAPLFDWQVKLIQKIEEGE